MKSFAGGFRALMRRPAGIDALIASIDASEAERILDDWESWAHPAQLPPAGDWQAWLFLGGRGAGKTRAGAEWIRARIAGGAGRIALVGPTHGDVREVMIAGPSGLRSLGPRRERPVWEATRRRLVWPSGAVAYTFSGEDPDALRGPQFDTAWADEFAAWRYPQGVLDMLRFGLRLGADPRLMVTTTPRPLPALKRLIAAQGTAVTHATSEANAAHLAPGFIRALREHYGASRLALQELEGRLVDDPEGALWTREMIDAALAREAVEAERIVVAVDPPAGSTGDECGIVVAGAAGQGARQVFSVIADYSLRARPEGWAKQVAKAFTAHEADSVVAESNQGGEMVRAVLAAALPGLPVRLVHASRAKRARAEPVAALYAAGRVAHAMRMPGLEDQMCAFGAPGFTGSPDRVDALVWAIAALKGGGAEPRLRWI
ncbi:DNA-packaging protein [Glycocaulis sp.]|uniref:DNA-packaging protein n=1 Tax=Glycocaulis sp. TaxID=1969725 RepID=UPI003D21C4BC